MKILQVIDALHIGGAEQMLLTISYELSAAKIENSICLTRERGRAFGSIAPSVLILELERSKNSLFSSVKRFRNFIIDNKITHIHAHSTSLFFVLLATFSLKTVVVWHLHFGNRVNMTFFKSLPYRIALHNISGVIAVNSQLYTWVHKKMRVPLSKIINIPNFPMRILQDSSKELALPGREGYRLLSVANIRPEKDHFNLIRAFYLSGLYEHWGLLCVGSFTNKEYFQELCNLVKELKLNDTVHFLGPRNDVMSIMKASNIAIISSSSEGLPVALLEYGQAEIPVICTDVGECANVLKNGRYGTIVEAQNPAILAKALSFFAGKQEDHALKARAFKREIDKNYSSKSGTKKLCLFYEEIG